MKIALKKLTGACALSLILLGNLNALTLISPGVVGLKDDKLANSNVTSERTAAQKLLDMAASSVDGGFDPGTGLYEYMTSDTEYAGTLVGGLQTNLTASGWDWALAKYDGPNAGYVLFYLGGALASTIVPQFPAILWTTNEQQYAISHLTVFNASTSVPDGGLTVMLVGLGLVGAGAARRFSVR